MDDVQNNEKTTRKKGGVTGKGFMPGQSGNPGGRPKVKLVSEAIRQELAVVQADGRTNAEIIAAKLISKAKRGDVYAIKEVTDRIEGKPKASLEISNDLSEFTDEQLQKRIDDLNAELGYVRRCASDEENDD